MATKDKELAVIEPGAFPILAAETAQEVLDVLKDNMGESGIKITDLTKITVPSGGNNFFQYTVIDGDQASKTIEGIIILAPEQNGMWEKSVEEAPNSPPACFSPDGKHGFGTPGGLCAVCPMKSFGTATKGGGKACKDIRPLYTMLPGMFIPVNVQTPPTSIAQVRKYFTALSGAGIPHFGCITRIGMKPDKNSAGVEYNKLTFEFVSRLDKAQIGMIKALRDVLSVQAAQVPSASEAAGQAVQVGDQDEYDPFADDKERDARIDRTAAEEESETPFGDQEPPEDS